MKLKTIFILALLTCIGATAQPAHDTIYSIKEVDNKAEYPEGIEAFYDIGSGTGEEAIRVVKLSPNWIPAQKD